MFDREVAAHLVEGHAEVPELVAGFHGKGDVVVSGADLLGPLSRRRIGRTNNRDQTIAAKQARKMMIAVDRTRRWANCCSEAKASSESIEATITHSRPGNFTGA